MKNKWLKKANEKEDRAKLARDIYKLKKGIKKWKT